MIKQAYLQQFQEKVISERIPFTGSLELTHRCNLRCLHCYAGPQDSPSHQNGKELSTARILRLIDEITAAGCLFLLLTGGEPLVRKDFRRIYRYARKKGLVTSVFTNGTMIRDDILQVFRDYPPKQVEITIYGATAETHEKITGMPGSFGKCLEGIECLVEAGFKVKLKTILMTINSGEFYDMEKLASKYGSDLRFDAAISPRLNGDRSPLELRVPAEEAVEKEFSSSEKRAQWKDYFDRTCALPPGDSLYRCGAGLFSFNVDPYGHLQPCLMTTAYRYDLNSGSFAAGWEKIMPEIRQRRAPADSACTNCRERNLCNFCPAFFDLENGAEESCSAYICSIGKYRYNRVTKTCGEYS